MISWPVSGAAMSEIALAAMNSGLRGERLPNMGKLDKERVRLANAVYEVARNWSAGAPVKA